MPDKFGWDDNFGQTRPKNNLPSLQQRLAHWRQRRVDAINAVQVAKSRLEDIEATIARLESEE